ncbi:MAG: hypothetical protein JNL42_19045 [Anaerolineae bacterium]|nr:hypothetical protein [Anaerolineae bacterium]
MSDSRSTQEQLQQAQVVQERYSDILMSKPHVVGVAIGFSSRREGETDAGGKGDRKVCLIVMVDALIPEEQLAPEDRIPDMLGGIPVEVQLTGLFTAGFSTE